MTTRTTTSTTLTLPMTTVFTVQRGMARSVARALDFDLVAVGPTDEDALLKLRLAVKAHVEFGIKNGLCKEDIQVPAPQEFWDILTPESSIRIGEPIQVDHRQIIPMVRLAIDETEGSFSTTR